MASTSCHKLATSPRAMASLASALSTFRSVSACFSLKRTTSSLRSCTFDVFVLSPGVVGGFVPLPAAVDDGLVVLDVFPSHAGVSISTPSKTGWNMDRNNIKWFE